MTTASRLWHCDEMRFGLWGQVRRRWGLKGKKIIQPMQIVFRWSYLVLAVDVGRGELHWGWSQGMNQQQLVPIFEQWPMDGVVWDGAPSHRGKLMGQLGFGRISLPAYSPELNPAERVFEEVRRHIEGEVYPSLEAKSSAIEHLLRQLKADKPRLKRLIGWDWLQRALGSTSQRLTLPLINRIGISYGAVIWRITGGEGEFQGASGHITSNFAVSATGEAVDNNYSRIFIP